VFTHDAASSSATFPLRFNGPPGSANGGIAVGALACPALASNGAARVARIQARLRSAVLCDRALDAVTSEAGGLVAVALHLDGAPLIDGVVTFGASDAPEGRARQASPLRSDDRLDELNELARVAVKGTDRPPFFEETGDHPIAGCFSCGPNNPRGMHIYPRAVSDGVTCAYWETTGEFDDGDGTISPMIVASALDCSSGICMPFEMQRELLAEDRFFLLGSLDVRFLRGVPVNNEYRVIAKAGARDGRKFFGRSALFDDAGTPYATTDATWIIAGISRTEAFGER
jgi:hypothetical protein